MYFFTLKCNASGSRQEMFPKKIAQQNFVKFLWSRFYQPFKRHSHRMVKYTQTIRRQQPTNCLSEFDHFVGMALKRLKRMIKTMSNILAKVLNRTLQLFFKKGLLRRCFPVNFKRCFSTTILQNTFESYFSRRDR